MNEFLYFGIALLGFAGGFLAGCLHSEAKYWAEQAALWKREGERIRANR